MNVAGARKAIVAIIGLAAVLATQLPPGTPEGVQRWAPVVIGAATALGVYGTRNATSVPPPRAERAEPPPTSRIADERPQPPPRRPTG
jgi:hypothetical protein